MHLGAILASLLLVSLTGFFVLAEFAAVRVRSTQLEARQKSDPRAQRALEVHRHLGKHLSAIQVGITLCTITLGAVGEDALVEGIRTLFGHIPLPPKFGLLMGTTLGLVIITTIQVVLAELVPRTIAIQNAEGWALRTAAPLQWWSRLAYPLTWGLIACSKGVQRLLGISPAEALMEDHPHTEDELRRIMLKSHASGELVLSRKELIENVFEFSRRTVNEVAVPRNQVVFFDLMKSLADNLGLARTTPHTRIPAVEGDLDHVVGVIHIKELLWALHEQGDLLDLRALARPVFYVPEMRRIQDLLLDFQRRKQHMALVVNEHGGVDGLVTLEDILEELVGEIQDEFDREAIHLQKTRAGAWLAQGTVTLEQLEDHLDLKLEVAEGTISLGGYFQEQLGRVLRVGDELIIQSWRVRVLSMRGMAPSKFLLRPSHEDDGPSTLEDRDAP